MKEVRGKKNTASETEVRRKYEAITKHLIERACSVSTMESCTAGQVISLLTDTEGSSAVIKGGFVTYSNEAKILAGVSKETIDTSGVYSAETAEAMAAACRDRMQTDLGIGVTGSFGNVDPNNADSIPGEVYFAIASGVEVECFHCTVPVQESRFLYKLYMADVIADALGEMIRLSPQDDLRSPMRSGSDQLPSH